MGQAKRRGNFEERKAESEFYASEQKRLEAWLYDHRPVVVSLLSDGSKSRQRTSSLQRALLLCALAGIGAYVDQDGKRIN